MDRICACGCGRSLDGRRRDARYATSTCRSTAARLRAGEGITPERSAAFWKTLRNAYRPPSARIREGL